PHVPVCRHRHDDAAVPDLRRALRDDGGRSSARHRHDRAADVRAGLPLVAHGPRERDLVRAVRAHAGLDRGADLAAARAAGGRMRRPGGALLLNAALVALAVLTAAPLLWMVSASFMSPGESSTFPPPLLPVHPTFGNYAALFTRLHLARNFLNSVVIAVVGT